MSTFNYNCIPAYIGMYLNSSWKSGLISTSWFAAVVPKLWYTYHLWYTRKLT